MPSHKPIKFKTTIEPNLIERVKEIMAENKRAKTILNATLAMIAVGGILTVGALAPGVLGGISRVLRRKKKNNYEQYRQIWQNFNYLKQRGNLKFIKEENGCLLYEFSQKGRQKIRKFIVDELSIKRVDLSLPLRRRD